MARFKDAVGREWDVSIDTVQLRAIHKRLGVRLGRLDQIDELAADPMLLVDVLYVLCESQVKAARSSDEDFGRAMTGDAILAGFEALQDAYADFCPSQKREALRAILAKQRALEATAAMILMRRIDGLSAGEESPSKTLNSLPGNTAASSESIPLSSL